MTAYKIIFPKNEREVHQFGHYHREMWYLGRLWYSSGKNTLVNTYTEFAPGWHGYYREWR